MPTGESLLPPTGDLSPDEFEDFTERLLNAQKFATHAEARCIEVARWGRRGDKQNGIDFAGRLSDGRRAAWQCKRYSTFNPTDVRETVAAATCSADVHHLVLSCEASSSVRVEIDQHPDWVLLDKRGLGQRLEDLPLHKRREVLDETWGQATRKRLMRTPGEDRFTTLPIFAESRRDATTVLNDLGPLAGRGSEVEALRAATDRTDAWPSVVLVAGPGGRGKTRLLVEALATFEARHPRIPLLVMSDGMLSDPRIVDELPQQPATLVVDDAHRDPAALRKLAVYAREVPGTQLIIASRPSALASVRAEVTPDLAPEQVCSINVEELDLRDARRLVSEVSDGTTLPFVLREYLAAQAVHSPHVAVIAVNLIERGQLSGALGIDAALREQVLNRYRDVTTGLVEGFSANTVNRLLAVFGALGPVDDEPIDLRQRMAKVIGVTPRELLSVRAAMLDRGVLVHRARTMQVVPEILAESAMEREAVDGGLDTGFAREVWATFGTHQGHRLMLALADLDWRLVQQNHPSVIEAVWNDFSTQLLATDLDELYTLATSLERLATTIPHRFFSLLEALRKRLRRELDRTSHHADHESDGTYSTATGAGLRGVGTAGVREARNRYKLEPVGPHDVLQSLAPAYARCAVAESGLLEGSLEALWDLRRSDGQTTGRGGHHTAKTAVQQLADLRHMRDRSVAGRIVDRVALWLEESPLTDDVVTPLFALRNLTSKGGVDTEQTGSRTLQLSPYRFSPGLVRPLRDQLRTVLERQAGGQDVRRAAEAVDLLDRMVRQPDAPPGESLTTADVLAWEDDDLATLAALDAASRSAPSSVVRRGISRLMAWHAEHARSVPVRHAALVLQTALDDREDDELADVLLPGLRTGGPARRGVTVPGLDGFRTEVEEERIRRAGLTEVSRSAEDRARRAARVEKRMEWHSGKGTCQSSAIRLLSGTHPGLAIAELDRAVREVAAFQPDQRPWLHGLYEALTAEAPESVAALVQAVADTDPGPMDADLHLLLDAWRQHDELQMLRWLGDLRQHRSAVRIAAANAFDSCGWHGAGQPFLALFEQGVRDPQPEVRNGFWRASGALLLADPVSTSERLIAGDASSFACSEALSKACDHDGRPWGRSLSSAAAASALCLVDRTEWSGYTSQQVVVGIAASHPLIVLEHLLETDSVPWVVDGDVDGLSEALDSHGEVLARWLVGSGTSRPTSSRESAVALALADGLGAATATALEQLVPGLDAGVLTRVLNDLALSDGPSGQSTWPQQRPGLARAILHRARVLGAGAVRSSISSMESAMFVRSWSSMNGVSEELQGALDVTAARADDEPDEELRSMYARARQRITAQVSDQLQQHDRAE